MRILVIVLRIVVASVLLGVAAVLLVEGALVGQLGEANPLAGQVVAVEQGGDVSRLRFTYVKFDGTTTTGRCAVPVAVGDSLQPGAPVDIHERAGLLRTYACVREGIASIQSENTGLVRWGLAAAIVCLLLVLHLVYSLVVYVRQQSRATRSRAPASGATIDRH